MKSDCPLFSIIIPTHARPKQLGACLQSLVQLDYPRDRFEVIVVDDGSPCSLQAVTDAYCDQIDVILLKQPHAGPATARNNGARRARGQFLAFTDDDCRPAPGWLRALAARFAHTPNHAIGGRAINLLGNNPYSVSSQLLVTYLANYYNADPNRAYFLTSNNLALPTAHFCALGGFNTDYARAGAEDRDLCDRWYHHGYPISYASEVIVYHDHHLNLPKFYQQHFNYGRGAYQFHRARARRNCGRIKLEPWPFYKNMLFYPSSHAGKRQALRVMLLLIGSQVANLTGFAWQWWTQPRLKETVTPKSSIFYRNQQSSYFVISGKAKQSLDVDTYE